MEGGRTRAQSRGVGVADRPSEGINGNPNLSGSGDLQVARPIPPAGVSTRQRRSDPPGGEGPIRAGSRGARVHPVPAGPCHRSGCAAGGRRPGVPGEAHQSASRGAGDGERKSPRGVDPEGGRRPCLGRDGDGVSSQILIHPQESPPADRWSEFDLRDRGDFGANDHGSTR